MDASRTCTGAAVAGACKGEWLGRELQALLCSRPGQPQQPQCSCETPRATPITTCQAQRNTYAWLACSASSSRSWVVLHSWLLITCGGQTNEEWGGQVGQEWFAV